MVEYGRARKIEKKIGRKPYVIATIVRFALFPITLILGAYACRCRRAVGSGALREIGESARKAMFVFFKQKTAYEITYGDWSSDVCSSDLLVHRRPRHRALPRALGLGPP